MIEYFFADLVMLAPSIGAHAVVNAAGNKVNGIYAQSILIGQFIYVGADFLTCILTDLSRDDLFRLFNGYSLVSE